ncbi:MAG: hypothetical protein ACM3YE_18180, partial [Bacteroidota bacterium]
MLYGNFKTIAELLDDEKSINEYPKILDDEIKKLADKVFTSVIPKTFLKEEIDSIDKILNRKYFKLMAKIKFATMKKGELEYVQDISRNYLQIFAYGKRLIYEGGYENGDFNGEGKFFNDTGELKFSGIFKDGILITGTMKDYYQGNLLMYEVQYRDGNKTKGKLLYKTDNTNNSICYDGEFKDNEVYNGLTEMYYPNYCLRYKGEVKNGEFDGEGIYYRNDGANTVEYKGKWHNGNIIIGEHFGGKYQIKYFKGEFNRENEWNGQVEYGENYENRRIKKFKGEIKEGEPWNGKGLIFFTDAEGNSYNSILDEDYSEDYYPDENDDNIEADSRKEKMREFNEVKSEYGRWEEYIQAEWENGVLRIAQDDIMNKNIYYYKNSEIKNSGKDK